jgi:HK97 family phage prohead protease
MNAIEAYEHLAAHEAAHAAAGLMLGLDVRHAHLDDDRPAGHVLIDGVEHDPQGRAVVLIAAALADGCEPLEGKDAADLQELAAAGVDIDVATSKALELTATREFDQLQQAIPLALEQRGSLDAAALHQIKGIVADDGEDDDAPDDVERDPDGVISDAAVDEIIAQMHAEANAPSPDRNGSSPTKGTHMEHMVKAATVTATDQGEFTAIAAAWTVDRVKDHIVRGAFAQTIQRWQASGKRISLHWNHDGEASNIIGSIDPRIMAETDAGLRVSGRLDLEDSSTAREAWRSMKNGSMSLSFGYVTTTSRKRNDGINELHELDLFEISIVPHPANPDTRIIEMKAIGHHHDIDPSDAALAKAINTAFDGLELRLKSDAVIRENAPIVVHEFPC